MGHRRKHRLVLVDRGETFLRWVPTCACGWNGTFARHRRSDAEIIYHDHVARRTKPPILSGPRKITPVAKLPTALRPRARECEMEGTPHARAWAMVAALSDGYCHWCRLPFTEQRPPTEDHVIPKSDGGARVDGVVLACQACNSARGDVPFGEYLEAVEAEHIACVVERREFRRPKRRLLDGEWVVTTMTRREVRALRAATV